jgi:hypothetical protein
MKVITNMTQINLMNVFEIDKQQFVTQFNLAERSKRSNIEQV